MRGGRRRGPSVPKRGTAPVAGAGELHRALAHGSAWDIASGPDRRGRPLRDPDPAVRLGRSARIARARKSPWTALLRPAGQPVRLALSTAGNPRTVVQRALHQPANQPARARLRG